MLPNPHTETLSSSLGVRSNSRPIKRGTPEQSGTYNNWIGLYLPSPLFTLFTLAGPLEAEE